MAIFNQIPVTFSSTPYLLVNGVKVTVNETCGLNRSKIYTISSKELTFEVTGSNTALLTLEDGDFGDCESITGIVKIFLSAGLGFNDLTLALNHKSECTVRLDFNASLIAAEETVYNFNSIDESNWVLSSNSGSKFDGKFKLKSTSFDTLQMTYADAGHTFVVLYGNIEKDYSVENLFYEEKANSINNYPPNDYQDISNRLNGNKIGTIANLFGKDNQNNFLNPTFSFGKFVKVVVNIEGANYDLEYLRTINSGSGFGFSTFIDYDILYDGTNAIIRTAMDNRLGSTYTATVKLGNSTPVTKPNLPTYKLGTTKIYSEVYTIPSSTIIPTGIEVIQVTGQDTAKPSVTTANYGLVRIKELGAVNDIWYYATTTNIDQINVSTANKMQITLPSGSESKPLGTDVKYLVSIDGRNNWGVLSGNSFISKVDNSTLSSHNWSGTNAMTSTQLSSTEFDVSAYNTIDFAIALKTTINTITPSLDQLVISTSI